MNRILIALLSCTALSVPSGALSQTIGTLGSSEPSIEGTPPGAAVRVLGVGTQVVADERVVTSATGRGQLLFVDQTSMTLAPNSDLVLNKFVFDPDRGTGEIAVTLGKGALRFIGGKITKSSEGTIRTPTATIGVRGGIALIDLFGPDVRAILLAGEYVCVEGGTNRHCTTRAGGIVTPAGYQGTVEPTELERLLNRLDGASEPDAREARYRAGADAVGPFDRRPVSTIGEELEDDIIEDDIREDLFDQREIGIIGLGDEPPYTIPAIEPVNPEIPRTGGGTNSPGTITGTPTGGNIITRPGVGLLNTTGGGTFTQ